MFCEKCGTKLIDGAKFCTKCGAQVNIITATYNPQEESIEVKGDAKANGETLETTASNAEIKSEELHIKNEFELAIEHLKNSAESGNEIAKAILLLLEGKKN